MKALRIIVGVLLLPVCLAATLTLAALVGSAWTPSLLDVPANVWATLIGFGVWILVYFGMPRPVRSYVLAHELSHAIWGWATGARVHGIRVSQESGSTRLSKTNLFITLGPYFSPLYMILAVALYMAASVFVDLSPYAILWHALVGFTWGFHVTFTLSTLSSHQSDIDEFGSLLSYTVIYLFNTLIVIAWVVISSTTTFSQFILLMGHNLRRIGCGLWSAASTLADAACTIFGGP